ncbi:YdcF family protein, partial [Salmonella enterica subsp. enterica serovar Derby]
MMIGLALCVVPLAFYAWLVDRRPGAWSNGIVLAVGL